MHNDVLSSLQENIKLRRKNPFFGTLVIVWVVRHWDFIVTVFDITYWDTPAKRIAALTPYLGYPVFLNELLLTLLISFGVLVATYALLDLARLITNFFEKNVTPLVYKVTDKSSVVLKTDYQEVVQQREVLLSKLDEEKNRRYELQAEIDRLLSRKNETDPYRQSSSETQSDDISKLRAKTKYYLDTWDAEKIKLFKHVRERIVSSLPLSQEDVFVRYLNRQGIVTPRRATNVQDQYIYDWTPLGDVLSGRINSESNNVDD